MAKKAHFICQMGKKHKQKLTNKATRKTKMRNQTKIKQRLLIKQNHSFAPLENSISQILKPIFTKKKDNFLVINNLQRNWQKIVGEECWQFCAPKKMQFEKNKKAGASLYIKAYNSTIAFYLEANCNQIIQNIASYYGYKIVAQIRIIQEPKNVETIEKKLILENKITVEQKKLIENYTSKIKDEDLKLTLQNLGKSIFATLKT